MYVEMRNSADNPSCLVSMTIRLTDIFKGLTH